MAAVEKFIKTLSGADEKAAKAKEQLDLLTNAAKANLKIAEGNIAASLRGEGQGIERLYIVPDSVMQGEFGYTVSTSQEVDAGITEAIDTFFKGSKDDVKNGFKEVIKTAINVLFASTKAGEQSDQKYFVTILHNAIVRVDVYFWKYYFAQKSITDDINQAFCYVLVKSIVDHKKVSLDTLVYLISEQMNDDLSKVSAYVDEIRNVYKKIEGENPKTVARRAMAAM
jgi:hypothetical protein